MFLLLGRGCFCSLDGGGRGDRFVLFVLIERAAEGARFLVWALRVLCFAVWAVRAGMFSF